MKQCVVRIATVDPRTGGPLPFSEELYVSTSLGDALDTHAPDPAPNAQFVVKFEGVTTN